MYEIHVNIYKRKETLLKDTTKHLRLVRHIFLFCFLYLYNVRHVKLHLRSDGVLSNSAINDSFLSFFLINNLLIKKNLYYITLKFACPVVLHLELTFREKDESNINCGIPYIVYHKLFEKMLRIERKMKKAGKELKQTI